MSDPVNAYAYVPRGEWTGPQHERPSYGQEAFLSVHFFWTTWGEPYLRRVPAGSFPASSAYRPRHSIDVVMPPVEPDATVVALSYVGDPPTFPHEGADYVLAVQEGRAVRCIACRWVSFHPDDAANGWCSNCQKFTGVPFDGDEPGYYLAGSTRQVVSAAGYSYVREDA